MEKQELIEEVMRCIDDNAGDMDQGEYLDFLEQVASDLGIRAEAVRDEIQDDEA